MNLIQFKMAFCTAAIAVALLPARSDMALAYHGRLVATGDAKISTKVPMTVEFRLFTMAEPGETAPLWGRLAPVRFHDDGSFYVELSDSGGTASQNARFASLADAFSAAGTNAWLSVKPAGYGELLPRKRVSGVHRAERAAAAKAAVRLEAQSLAADTLVVDSCKVGTVLSASRSFVSGGGAIAYTIEGTADATVGASGGTVLFSPSFDNWDDLDLTNYDVPRFGCDMLIGYKYDPAFGVFSLPAQGGSPGSGIEVSGKAFLIQKFLYGFWNPFF